MQLDRFSPPVLIRLLALASAPATVLVAVPSQLLLMLQWAQRRHCAPVAQVQLVLRNTNNALTAGTVLVVWDSGDWKVNGTVSPPPSAQVDSLAGFVSWSGVN